MEYFLLAFVIMAAFLNGANDVSKGVATLQGSGLASFRGALLWGTLWTMAGGVAAFFIASALLQVFLSGIVSADLTHSGAFSLAVAAGLVIWLFLSTGFGMPVSTTHTLVGAMCGTAFIAFGPATILWGSLGYKVIIPLMFSPLIALLLTSVIHKRGTRLFNYLSRYCICFGFKERACCVGYRGNVIASIGDIAIPSARAERVEICDESRAMPAKYNFNDILHWASSALTSFARGLNDTPKIVAVMAAAALFFGDDDSFVFITAVLAMGLGGYLGGLKVTETLSSKVTGMDRGDSVIANLSTAVLVIAASLMGMPVSTTHVSSSSIVGIGLKRAPGSLNREVVLDMVIAWCVTLPMAGIISGAVYLVLRTFL